MTPVTAPTPASVRFPEAKTAIQAEMLANRLHKRYRRLSKWARRQGFEAWRLYDRDIPEIPLVLDVYRDAVAGALYQRPYEKDEAEEAHWLNAMKQAAALALSIDESNIFLKLRHKQRDSDQYERAAMRHITRDIAEGSLRFRVNLSDYLDTGLFLDARPLRQRLAGAESGMAAGRRVLNLFCYTGSFSVAALHGGAVSVDSVDLSQGYLDWAKTNLALNGYTDTVTAPLHRMDCSRFLDEAAAARRRWDLIILDPPVFSNSKKMSGILDLRRDAAGLVKKCLALLAKDGILYFAAKGRSFGAEALAAVQSAWPASAIRNSSETLRDPDFGAAGSANSGKIPQWWEIKK
jgi:23S rRNA G2069 N7-methylase RlmK/C1962 C5-methylase RlmI